MADAKRLSPWTTVLAAMGWTLPEVLGRDRIDHMSLVWLMGGQRVSAVTTEAVILRDTNGAITCVYRRGA